MSQGRDDAYEAPEVVGEELPVSRRNRLLFKDRWVTLPTKQALELADAHPGMWIRTGHKNTGGIGLQRKAWPEYDWRSRDKRLYVRLPAE